MSPEQRSEVIAAACHSAWYAYAVLALGEAGDPWERAPEWQKSSILHAVAFWDALDTDTLPFDKICAASHVAWMNERLRTGWVYGLVKDPEKKTHHCLVPYEELPEAQRLKDAVVVRAYLALRTLLPPEA